MAEITGTELATIAAVAALTTGVVKVASGTLGIAVAGTDYVAPATTITAGAGLSGGGDLSANRTVSMPNTGPGAGAIGTAGVASVTLDAQGRVTAASAASYVPQATTITAGAGLSGGGDLSTSRTISMPNTGPGAGVVGGAGIASVTLDAQGRVTAAATATYLTAAAPVGAQYLTLATDSTLTVERVLTPSTGLTAVDGGAGAAYTLTNDLLTGKAGGQTIIGGTAASENLILTPTSHATKGHVSIPGRMHNGKGADVASAATLTLGTDGNTFTITGTTNIDFITTTGWSIGVRILLYFPGALSVNHNTGSPPANTAPIFTTNGVALTTSATFVATIAELQFTGTDWRMLWRKL